MDDKLNLSTWLDSPKDSAYSILRRIYFALIIISIKIPLIDKFVINFYIKNGAYQSKRNSFQPLQKKCLFIMYEPRFENVLNELEKKGVNVVILARGVFDYLFLKHLSDYKIKCKGVIVERELEKYFHYKKEREKYRVSCKEITRKIMRYYCPSAVILPKYNDDYTLDLIQAFSDTGWVTVIYDREGTIPKKRIDLMPTIISPMAPTCNYIIVYNNEHKLFFDKIFSLTDIKKPQVVIMGNPGSDEWFKKNKRIINNVCKEKTKIITFLAFGEFSYVYHKSYLIGKEEVWRGLLTDIHETLKVHVLKNKNDILWYKRGPKGKRDYWLGSEELLRLNNVKLISNTANTNLLMQDSDLIIAFQTTALIDAMHTNKIIIYCAWGPNYDALKDGLINFEKYALDGAILHAKSPTELMNLLMLNFNKIDINFEARKKCRELFTSNPDGNVSKRFAEWYIKMSSQI